MISDETKAYIQDWQKTYWEAETFFFDNGFVSYRIHETMAIIENYFVPSSRRGVGDGRRLVFKFKDYLREMEPEVTHIFGEVQLNLPGLSDRLMIFLHFGATVYDVTSTAIRVIYDVRK